jgi:hypothetical protein
MKKIKKISLVFMSLSLSFFGCTKADLKNDEQPAKSSTVENIKIEDPEPIYNAARIASDNWDVQTKGNTYDFYTDVAGRYTNNGGSLSLTVFASDPKTSSNTIYARTELRSKNEFSGNTTHTMNVTMQITNKGGKVIIAQLFDKTDNDDQNVILYHDNKIYARSTGGSETYLADLPTSSFSISIKTSSNDVTLTARGQSKTYSTTGHTCYFKTGAYLNSTSGNASCVITSLSQT